MGAGTRWCRFEQGLGLEWQWVHSEIEIVLGAWKAESSGQDELFSGLSKAMSLIGSKGFKGWTRSRLRIFDQLEGPLKTDGMFVKLMSSGITLLVAV